MDKDNRQIYEDEIDLLELAAIVWKRKLYIIGFVFLVSLAAVVYSLSLDNVYESRTVLKPTAQTSAQSSLGGLSTLAGFAGININSGGSVYADINVILSNKDFLADFIKENNLAPKLLKDPAIAETAEFKQNEKFNLFQLIYNDLKLAEDKNTQYITFSYNNTDPALAKEILTLLLKDISGVLRTKQLENLDKRIENYKLEIDRAADLTLKAKLSELVASLIQSKVLANADEYYGFSIMTEPSLSDPLDKVGPKRAQMCLAAFFVSLFLAVFSTLVLHFSGNNLKKRKKAYILSKNIQ
ncbi:Wzz/FepE/Etk N-terminal domain-containing protein [Geovibrio ferrireducens]|uniref:Wzz/FepE/Etk N-terminal domain-containing protein n=1 Tax=Geovibrio ferrireducens TaxID=46201 RepID=UPI002247BE07|nr:Wzz/FepE/Etk N-terminal domain-containing protein [Geovibrio ferrireducens]